jgi:cytochrome P450
MPSPQNLSPVSAVTAPDPYPYYAELTRQRPFGHDGALGVWVAADAASVTAVLREPALRVRPPAEPVPAGIVGTPAGQVYGHLVRMTDGDLQQRLKRLVVTALGTADAAVVAERAAERTADVLKAGGEAPLEELMFGVPARVVADLCGLDDRSDEASRLIGDFVGCIPATATAEQQATAARAAARLLEILGPRLDERGDGLLGELVRAATADDWHERAPLLANSVGLLSQTYDATAGLIGNTLLAVARDLAARPDRPAGWARFVREVARHDAPIQNTRRFASAAVRIGTEQVPAGQAVLLVLAAANRDPAVNDDPHVFRPDRPRPAMFTFGAAAHRCPGEDVAVAIASAVVDTLLSHGFDPATLPAGPAYRPLANARIPVL